MSLGAHSFISPRRSIPLMPAARRNAVCPGPVTCVPKT